MFAKATHTPVGYLLLDEPPEIDIPISDFRTVGSAGVNLPSPNLLDTIYLCQQRQEWYREEVQFMGEQNLDFVGSMSLDDNVESAARRIGTELKFSDEPRQRRGSKDGIRRHLVDEAENLGILVMVSGVVGNSTSRVLDVCEFRGFALADPWAPLVFVNGKDGKGAQIFTLVHELAHIWLGRSAVSDNSVKDTPTYDVEQWCNAVAAELLVPAGIMRKLYDSSAEVCGEADRLAGLFKVSKQVILRRMYDVGGLEQNLFLEEYGKEVTLAAEREMKKKAGKKENKTGGNYYNNVLARASKKFTRALLASTMEGRTIPIVSRRLLDVWNAKSIDQISKKIGVGR